MEIGGRATRCPQQDPVVVRHQQANSAKEGPPGSPHGPLSRHGQSREHGPQGIAVERDMPIFIVQNLAAYRANNGIGDAFKQKPVVPLRYNLGHQQHQ
jgi:hypothetical protein